MSAGALIVAADALDGGLGTLVHAEAAWFTAAGWDVTVAAPGPRTPTLAGTFADWPLPATGRNVAGMVRAAAAMRRLVRDVDPDAVHCHGLRSFAATRLAGVGRPFATVHGVGIVPGDPRGYGRVRATVRRIVPAMARVAWSVSPDAGPGWTFLPHASARLASLERAAFPEGDVPTFLWLGRLENVKRPERFVQAVAELARERPVRGVIAGTGPRAEEVEALVAQLRAPVDVVGHRDPAPLLADAWAVVLFSRHEGVPLVVEEAMWVGRAVVATPLPGIEWLAGATARWAVDDAGATAALRELCDRATARRLGDLAATRVRSLLTADAPWSDVERAFRS